MNGYDTTAGSTCVRSFRAVVILPLLPPVVVPLHAKEHFSYENHQSLLQAKFHQPTILPDTEIKGGTGSVPRAMSCGGRHCALVTMDGRLITWGANDYGQLGRGFFTSNNKTNNGNGNNGNGDGDDGGADGGVASSAEVEVNRKQENIKISESVRKHKEKYEKLHCKQLSVEDVAELTRKAKEGQDLNRVKTPETPTDTTKKNRYL